MRCLASLRLGQDLASAAEVRTYLDLCGQAPVSACAFSAGTPAATEAKFARLLQILRRHPVNVGSPPQAFTYADLFVNFPLGDVDRWQLRSADLQKLWTDATSSSGQPSGQASFGLPAAASAGVYTGLDQNYAVSCTDEADPRNVSDYAAAARLAQARAGGYGLYFTWTEEPCADWPATAPSDRYTGPWNRRTASTILVMSLTGDPATPYQDAIAMTRDLARARLLTVAGWGHTELANPSNCAIRYEVKYLTTGVLPPAGVVCAQNTAPFPVPCLRAVRRARVGATLRTQVGAMLAEIGLRRPGRVYGRYVSFESDVSRPPHSSRPPLSKRLRPWHWIAIDVVVAGLAGLVGALTAANDVVTQPSRLLLAAVIFFPIALRRRYPLPTFGALVVMAIFATMIGWALPAAPVVAYLYVAYVLYTVTVGGSRRASLAAAAVPLTVILVTELLVRLHQFPADRGGADLAWAVFALVIAWMTGDSARQRRRYVQLLQYEAASSAVAGERLRIARELHDVVAHSMSVIAVQAGYGQYVIDASPAGAREALGAIQATSRDALDEMRRMLGVLRQQDAACGPDVACGPVATPEADVACGPDVACGRTWPAASRLRAGRGARGGPYSPRTAGARAGPR